MAFGMLLLVGWFKENNMKLSKETVKKLWATTECISDGKKKKPSRAND